MAEVESETKQKGSKLLKWFGKSKKLVFSCVQHNKKEKPTRRSINPRSYSSTVQHTSSPPTSTPSRKTVPFSSPFSNSQLSSSRTSAYSTPSIPTTPTTPTSPTSPFRKTHRHQISRTIETTTTSATATPAEIAAVSWETPDTDDDEEAFDNIPNKKRRRWGNIGVDVSFSFDHIEKTTVSTKTESTIESTSNSIHSDHDVEEKRPQQLPERNTSRLLSFSPMMSDGRVWDVKDYRDDGEERDNSKQMPGFTPTTESLQIFPYKLLTSTNSYPLPTPPLSPDSPSQTSPETASTPNTRYSLFSFSHSRPHPPSNAPLSPPLSPVSPQTPTNTNQFPSYSHSRTHTPSDSLSSQSISTPIANFSESYHPPSLCVPYSPDLSKSPINDVSEWAASTSAALSWLSENDEDNDNNDSKEKTRKTERARKRWGICTSPLDGLQYSSALSDNVFPVVAPNYGE